MLCPSCQTPVESGQRFCPGCGTSLTATPAQGGDPLIGQTLDGKYRVTRKIGEGGMGAVYEGEQRLGTAIRKVAVKTLHPALSRDPSIEARFRREVGTIAELEHPNTIQVFDFGATAQGVLYFVMEFLQAKSLGEVLAAQGAMSPERARHVLLQICGSLDEAHGRGIVHRDLKPDNIALLERAGIRDFVKVLDFGIAKRSGEDDKREEKLTQQGMVLGTPPYMSPEQFTGRPIDSRSDIYSLGVVAYEMLTGRLPFDASTTWEWATQHTTQPPIPMESLAAGMHVPVAMRDAIRRALAKSPGDRFPSMRELAAALGGSAIAMAAPEVPRPAAVNATTPHVAMMTRSAHTPADGNVSFPTSSLPASEPSPIPAKRGSLLLGIAVVIGIASVAAIAVSLRSGSRSAPRLALPPGAETDRTPAPATSLAPDTVTADTSRADDTSRSDVPPLMDRGAALAHSPESASERETDAGASAGNRGVATKTSGSGGAQVLSSSASTQPKTTPPHDGSDSAPYNGIECQRARTLKAEGHPRMAHIWAEACRDKGGTP